MGKGRQPPPAAAAAAAAAGRPRRRPHTAVADRIVPAWEIPVAGGRSRWGGAWGGGKQYRRVEWHGLRGWACGGGGGGFGGSDGFGGGGGGGGWGGKGTVADTLEQFPDGDALSADLEDLFDSANITPGRFCAEPPRRHPPIRLAKAILRRKKGLFVTGGGGVGKTRLLRQCADKHRQAHGGGRAGLHVVAPTGVAAAAAGGVTIHSYLRLPAGCFGKSLSEEQDAARLYNIMVRLTKRRLADTTLILFDEVSMVLSRMFTLLIYSLEIAHAKMESDVVWRIVVFGDFFELPPLRGEEDNNDTSGLYAFKSVSWNRLFQNEQLLLRYVWRQEDKKLIKMLSHLRVGHVTTDLADFLHSCAHAFEARVRNGGVRTWKSLTCLRTAAASRRTT